MSTKVLFVAALCLLAFLAVAPAAEAQWNGGFQQDWGGLEDQCMGIDDPFCGGGEAAGFDYFKCLDDIDYTKSALHVCNATCSCKYKKDVKTCKDPKFTQYALTACYDISLRNFTVCVEQCGIDYNG